MGSRHLALFIATFVCATALVLGRSRPALAAAPMSDVRGACAIAPPPTIPMTDATCDLGTGPSLSTDLALFEPGRAPTVARRASTDHDASLVAPTSHRSRRSAKPICLPPETASLSPGHYPPVFRPPRSPVAS